MPWYLYLALKQLFPTGKWITFFTFISVTGVAAGVWLLVATTGVMGGFGSKYRGMIVDTQGDIQILGPNGIDRPAEIEARVVKVPGVVALTPVAMGQVMLEYGAKRTFPNIQGIEVEQSEKVVPLRKYMVIGSLDDLDDDTVILSAGLARSIGAGLGSKVIVVTPLTLEKQKTD